MSKFLAGAAMAAALALAAPAWAQSYLTSASASAAQARSHAQALANGVDPNGVTQFWWPVVGGSSHLLGYVPPTATGAALAVNGSGFYGAQGLSAAEISALQSAAQLTSAGWAVPATAAAAP
jgi:hypothetical protein